MQEMKTSLETIYTGWHTYQSLLITALSPLTPEQLALQAAPHLRTIEDISTHMIGARVRWFSPPLGDGNKQIATLGRWDRRGGPVRKAEELVHGLTITWDFIQARIASWTPAEWYEKIPGEYPDDPEFITRSWVVWHLIEHDLHHGGEISLTLGMHKLKAPGL